MSIREKATCVNILSQRGRDNRNSILRIQNSFLKEKLEEEIGYPEYDKCIKNVITKLLRYLTVLTVWL